MTVKIAVIGPDRGEQVRALGGSPALMAQPAFRTFGAIGPDDALLGFIMLQTAAGEADIVDIAIAPTHRRRGIGRALLADSLKALKHDGVHRVHLEVDCANGAAEALYRASGFAVVGRRAQYYRRQDGTRSDALVMTLVLDQIGPKP